MSLTPLVRAFNRVSRTLDRLGTAAESATGIPAWASLPTVIGAGALMIAGVGFMLDVAVHIDDGRDSSPFVLSHNLILIGLNGLVVATLVAAWIYPQREDPARASVRLPVINRLVPVALIFLGACSFLSLTGFPLDLAWHFMFGEDVTLWGPTHLQMIGGAAFTTIGFWMLLRQGLHSLPADTERERHRYGAAPRVAGRALEFGIAAAVLIGFCTMQLEFDYGVPQFALLHQPLLIVVSSAVALVAMRIAFGPGAAIRTAIIFIAGRAFIALVVAQGWDHIVSRFPLFIAEALLVELVFGLGRSARKPVLAGAAGALIGSVGVLAEWGWSHTWSYHAWPDHLIPLAVVLGVPLGVAGGLLGSQLATSFARHPLRRDSVPAGTVAVCALAVVLSLYIPLALGGEQAMRADVTLNKSADGRFATPVVRFEDPSAADRANWFRILAWQGGGRFLSDLKPVRGRDGRIVPGTYRSEKPVPIDGTWKTAIRIESGGGRMALPLFMAADRDLDLKEISANDQVSAAFVPDKVVLQREFRGGSAWLQTVGYVLILSVWAIWALIAGWAAYRIRAPYEDDSSPSSAETPAKTFGASRRLERTAW